MTLPISPGTLGALQWPRHSLAPRGAYLLFGGILTVIAVMSLLPGLIAPSFDAAVFSVVGERVATGAVPYVDIFDHKPPGLYLLIAFGQLLGGSVGTWKIAWILSVGSVALTGVVVADTLRHLGWRSSAWVIGGLCAALLASFPLALGGGMGETAAVLPAAAALRLVAVGRPSSSRRLGAGVLAGTASAISLQAAPVLVAVVVTDVVRRGVSQARAGSLVASAWIAAGAGLVWAILLFLFGTAGATAAAVNALVGYNEAYQGLARLDDPMAAEAMHALFILGPLAVLALAGLAGSIRNPATRAVAAGAVAWVVLSVGFVVLQGRLELHYTGLLVVPLALLAPAGLHLQVHGPVPSLLRTSVIAGLLITAFTLSSVLVTAETATAMQVRSGQAERARSISTWINGHAPASGGMFVWGNAPELYLQADLQPASDYVYLLPLTTPGYVTDQAVQLVLQGFLAHPPVVIVDAGSARPGLAGMPPLLIDRPVATGDGRTADLLDPLRQFVRDRYVLAATVDGWPIYVLR